MPEKQSIDAIFKKYLPSDELREVNRILYGTNYEDGVCEYLGSNSNENFDLEKYRFNAELQNNRSPRFIRVAAIQHSIVLPTFAAVRCQRQAIFRKVSKMIDAAANLNVNILCLQELWNMPFGLCTREKLPVCEFAEDIETGPTTSFLKNLAQQYNMVIISPILERDSNHGDILWNTAVIISERGHILGSQRKNHIPPNGESGYYAAGTSGWPVFDTIFGRIAVSICYDRHHPQAWLAYALNGAEIVFNPCATTVNEHWWPIEARSAAIANNFYTINLNRFGTETFKINDGHLEKSSGKFFGSTYIAAPNGSRTKGLSTSNDGILYAELDMNGLNCGKKKTFGFHPMQRPQYYRHYFSALANGTFEPQLIE